ncbi:MAG: lysophospholipid acyltransferase family protein [Candidatus Orphnella occulta]|nr:lysophospholipid acyltransferase family protein [Candidatus Orphnella occulta]
MLFALYRIGIFIALNTPIRAGYRIAAFAASLYAFFSPADRDALNDNLKQLFPDYEDDRLKSIASQIFINFGKYLVDFFRFSLIDADYIKRYVKVEGRHHLDEVLKQKKGAILTSAHIGNWELGGVALAALGFPLSVVALTHKQDNIDKFFTQQRLEKGVGVIPVGIAVRRCFKVLANNGAIALVSDRDYFDNGLEVEFFGKKAIIPKGPALFSRRCLAPIVPVFMLRNKDDTFTLKILEPIMPVHTHNEHEDLICVTEKVIKVIEDVVKENPEQWFVFKRFWEKMGRGRG